MYTNYPSPLPKITATSQAYTNLINPSGFNNSNLKSHQSLLITLTSFLLVPRRKDTVYCKLAVYKSQSLIIILKSHYSLLTTYYFNKFSLPAAGGADKSSCLVERTPCANG